MALEASTVLDKRNERGRTALHLAASTGNYVAVSHLLQAGASQPIRCNRRSPLLHCSPQRVHQRMVSPCRVSVGFSGAIVCLPYPVARLQFQSPKLLYITEPCRAKPPYTPTVAQNRPTLSWGPERQVFFEPEL